MAANGSEKAFGGLHFMNVGQLRLYSGNSAPNYVKDQVYVPPLPASIPELKVRIRTAFETVTADMLGYRVDVCRITMGAHIEHL